MLSGGGPDVKDSAGNNWTGAFIDANGDPTVDLRNNVAAESRAKVIYEYLKQFTDDPGVQDTLTFLMTREVAHYQLVHRRAQRTPGQLPAGPAAGRSPLPECRVQHVQRRRIGPRSVEPGPRSVAGGHGMGVRGKPEQQWLGGKTRKNKGTGQNPQGAHRRSRPKSPSRTNSTRPPPDRQPKGRASVAPMPGLSLWFSAPADRVGCPPRAR